jgi:predicted O-linked N-acetylglucosamine transferase (SPINDLY family)
MPHTDALESTSDLVAEAARHFAEGRVEAAIAAVAKAARGHPEDVSVNFMAALIAWRLDDTAKALASATRCFDQAPMNGTVAELLASLHAQTGDLVESLYYGKLAIALPVDSILAGWLPGDFPSFDAAFLTIQQAPLLAEARRLLASGKLEAALDKARQHVEVAPHDIDGRFFYGTALLRAGRSAAALEVLLPLADAAAPAPLAASALARAFAAVGEPAMARHWHDAAVAGAPEDAAIAAARIADAPWLGVERLQDLAWRNAWRTRFLPAAKPRRCRGSGDKLRIGYIVSALAERQDAVAVAAVAAAHARAGTTVIGYGAGAQSWSENLLLRSGFDSWRNIVGLDPITLARTFAGDGLDVVIDVGGAASASALQALARLDTAIRVAWLSDPAGFEGAAYDAALSPAAAVSIETWHAPGGGYPLLRDWTRERPRPSEAAHCRFGADARLCQIDERTTLMWREVLDAVPSATLLLRANDMSTRTSIDRLVERFGTSLAARVDLLDAAAAEDFYAKVDVALAPILAVSPRMASEALACGVPVLALDDGAAQPCPSMLRALGLEDFIAAEARAYVAQAVTLAASAEKRAAATARVSPVADRAEASAAALASAIEASARTALARVAA